MSPSTTETQSERPVVLVVDDEMAIAQMYRRILEERYSVVVANDGQTALEQLTPTVDVVLLDRMMPDMSGDEVLVEIRERELECRVAMVTAVEPDLDIVAMGFDAYVQKPPTREHLFTTVEDLLRRRQYSADLRAYCSAVSKRAALQTTGPTVTAHPEYEALEDEIETMAERLHERTTDLTDDMTFLAAIRDIDDRRQSTA